MMIERVARAICSRHYALRFKKANDDHHVLDNVDANWDLYREDARAAIEAMMEPTEGMVDAGRPVDRMALRSVDSIYNAMIRAALEE